MQQIERPTHCMPKHQFIGEKNSVFLAQPLWQLTITTASLPPNPGSTQQNNHATKTSGSGEIFPELLDSEHGMRRPVYI